MPNKTDPKAGALSNRFIDHRNPAKIHSAHVGYTQATAIEFLAMKLDLKSGPTIGHAAVAARISQITRRVIFNELKSAHAC
jgi:hypothetical protein